MALDRRTFFRGAAGATLGGIGAAALAQVSGGSARPEPRSGATALAELDARIARAQRWAGPAPADWVRPRDGADHNVLIVGGGQSGIAIAHGLQRQGVGGVQVIDTAMPGQAGIWRRIARMHQLRTPKTMPGLEQDNPMLGFRAWFETLNGPTAFDELDRIPRLAWAAYLDWFQRVNGIEVRYQSRLIEVEPAGELLRLHLDVEGVRRVETTRKLVLANGYAGAGGPNVPGFLRDLPAVVWAHTASAIPFASLAGKRVGVIGAGASAFDAAAVALESGATEVHMFNRRPYVDYPGGSRPAEQLDRGHANVLAMSFELPDAVRWGNFVARERGVASVPLDSIARVVGFDHFRLHLNTSLEDVRFDGSRVRARAGAEQLDLDFLVAGTGYRIDLAAQPEIAALAADIALWRDRFDPAPGDSNDAAAAHPYLGPGFEFLPKRAGSAPWLRNIHCFNLAGGLSFGKPVGDVPSAADHPRIVAAIATDLYRESVDSAAWGQFIGVPVLPADPSPYAGVVAGA